MSTITALGHSCFQIETGDHTLLIDPFLTGNPQATVSAEDVNPDFIIVTHGHEDHVGDTVAIAKRTGATVISNFEIVNWLTAQGVENSHPQHLGGGFAHPFGHLKLTIAHHGSALPDGSYGGNPAGLLFTLEGKKIYHAGDTGLFYDMKLIGEEGIDVAILPIGDNFTMGPVDSIKAINFLSPKTVIPMHYNTWPPIEQDVEAWAASVKAQTSATPVILASNESLDVS
ncbi:metal-dependent hydrolase [Planctomycetaceae bacterium]|jgi:L-ascorbate metabolism protein UlaG (beta-lactamase superfamily)|nr:metal-dependent hydrolase [Planctomycetaceae bacterium]